jgi:arylsulfatase A-like enzyme
MNILLISSDQQHYDTLGIRNPRISTPNLDRLARGGMNFTRAYAASPVCSPSRSTVITGMYPAWHGCWNLGCKLPEDVPTIGHELQAIKLQASDADEKSDTLGWELQTNGYATNLIGKAHFQPLATREDCTSIECQPILRDLEFWKGFQGPWYGFEHVELARNHADEAHVGQHYALWLEEKGLKNWQEFYQTWPPDPNAKERRHRWDLPEEFHYTTWTTERTIAAIERDVAAHRPFFTWASYHDPHPPYLVPEPWASMYDPADMEPGELQDGELDKMPPYFALTQQDNPDFSDYNENGHGMHGFHSHLTPADELRRDMAVYYGMISFMDHQIGRILDRLDQLGIADETLVVFTTDHGHFLGQHGLVAKGAFLYEDLLRLPFVVRVPGAKKRDVTSSAMQSLVDLAPTFLDYVGAKIPGRMQGVSQLAVWRGEQEKAREEVIAEFRHQPTKLQLETYIGERWKMTIHRDRSYGELFDLETDPGEHRNLWDDPSYKEMRAEVMHRFLNAHLRREPMISPQIAGA